MQPLISDRILGCGLVTCKLRQLLPRTARWCAAPLCRRPRHPVLPGVLRRVQVLQAPGVQPVRPRQLHLVVCGICHASHIKPLVLCTSTYISHIWQI